MTIIPPGAKLAPVDLPPPPSSSDPREPESSGARRVSRTPQRAKSPFSSRASSPTRQPPARADSNSPPPLLAPKPRAASGASVGMATTRSSQGGVAGGAACPQPLHLSRPSSPSSIHSHGSAIFERDIEMPAAQSLSTLSHKGSRVFHHPHGSTLEHTVPAVLDDAVEALTATGPVQGASGLEIEAPASTTGIARSSSATLSPALRSRVVSMPRAVSSGASRSPSPESASAQSPLAPPPLSLAALSTQHGAAAAAAARLGSPTAMSPMSSGSGAISPSITSAKPSSPLADVSEDAVVPTSPIHAQVQAQAQSQLSRQRPAQLQQQNSSPHIPGGWEFGNDDGTDAGTGNGSAQRSENTSGAQTPVPSALPSHLTPTKEKRRVSFISYNDLLLSVPTSVTSLDDITAGNLSPEHLPGTVSPSVASRSPVMAASPSSLAPGMPSMAGGVGGVPDALRPLGGIEGEWQREGLGRGLEQRLEDLVLLDNPTKTATATTTHA